MGHNQKVDEPAIGVPYYAGHNPYQAGMIPPTAVYGDPKGIPIQQTMFRDTPAPFNCVFCGSSGRTLVRSKPSLAAVVGCMMPFMLGCCFLCPSMDCLWHKYHYCPNCKEKVADFEKSDPCIVVDPPQWTQPSFAFARLRSYESFGTAFVKTFQILCTYKVEVWDCTYCEFNNVVFEPNMLLNKCCSFMCYMTISQFLSIMSRS